MLQRCHSSRPWPCPSVSHPIRVRQPSRYGGRRRRVAPGRAQCRPRSGDTLAQANNPPLGRRRSPSPQPVVSYWSSVSKGPPESRHGVSKPRTAPHWRRRRVYCSLSAPSHLPPPKPPSSFPRRHYPSLRIRSWFGPRSRPDPQHRNNDRAWLQRRAPHQRNASPWASSFVPRAWSRPFGCCPRSPGAESRAHSACRVRHGGPNFGGSTSSRSRVNMRTSSSEPRSTCGRSGPWVVGPRVKDGCRFPCAQEGRLAACAEEQASWTSLVGLARRTSRQPRTHLWCSPRFRAWVFVLEGAVW